MKIQVLEMVLFIIKYLYFIHFVISHTHKKKIKKASQIQNCKYRAKTHATYACIKTNDKTQKYKLREGIAVGFAVGGITGA